MRFLRYLTLSVLLLVLAAAPAHSAPVTFTYPGGVSITLPGGDTYRPGDWITFQGVGFQRASGAGSPLVAVKPYGDPTQGSTPATQWSYDGPSRHAGPGGAEDAAPIWFESGGGVGVGVGEIRGRIQVPPAAGEVGPNGRYPGGYGHLLTFLSGSFSTDGQSATAPISIGVYFNVVVPAVDVGYVGVHAGASFVTGSVMTGGQAQTLTVRARGLEPSAPVSANLAGGVLTTAPVSPVADAGGEAEFTVTLPGDLTDGASMLQVSDGVRTVGHSLQVVTHRATLLTPNVRPGGTFVIHIEGYRAITGAGQHVALSAPSLGGVLHCLQASGAGDGLLVGVVPPAQVPGAVTFAANAGTNCVGGPGSVVVEPLPRMKSFPNGLNVDTGAPAISTPQRRVHASGTGNTVLVTGEGFPASESITATIAGRVVQLSNAKVGAGGSFELNLPVPAGVSTGARVPVVITAASNTAAAMTIDVIPAATAAITTTGPIVPGSVVSVDVTGFVRSADGAGQKVGVKLDGVGDVLGCVAASPDGTATLSVQLPADVMLGTHHLRVLAGTSCVSGGAINDLPGRSMQLFFDVAAAPVVVPPNVSPPIVNPPAPTKPTPPAQATPVALRRASTLTYMRGRAAMLRVRLAAGPAQRVRVQVATTNRVRVTPRGAARIVPLVKPVTTRVKQGVVIVNLRLTAAGRRAIALRGPLKVVVTVLRPGTTLATKRTFVIR